MLRDGPCLSSSNSSDSLGVVKERPTTSSCEINAHSPWSIGPHEASSCVAAQSRAEGGNSDFTGILKCRGLRFGVEDNTKGQRKLGHSQLAARPGLLFQNWQQEHVPARLGHD